MNSPSRDRTSNASATRERRDRANIRELLLESAIVEFGSKGFEAASTNSIAARADAHQPQINYHFSTKAELWRAAVDHLFAQLNDSLADIGDVGPEATFVEIVRRTVRFSAKHPELHQIILQEAMAPGERLVWLTETHVEANYNALRSLWRELGDLGVAAAIDERLIHYVMVGSSSLVFANKSEAAILIGADVDSDELVDAHIDGLIAMLLPGRTNSESS